jgi:hypothetical protein
VSAPATPFVAQLRRRPGVLRLAGADEPVLAVRVSLSDVWDTVLLEVAPSVAVLDVKRAALAEVLADGTLAEDYVCKLNGFEILDETQSVTEAGVRDGSTILVAHRRRRPVR